MSNEQIRALGLQELEKISQTNKNAAEWKTWLTDYQFLYRDDSFIGFTNILALKAVDDGNFGVGCILIDGHGNIVAQGNNEVFIPYFRSDRHAEMVVMDKFENTHPDIHEKEGYTLYTSLESCPMCLGAVWLAEWPKCPRYGLSYAKEKFFPRQIVHKN
ncbi:MAG: nucleoside deaminase [Candidatus Methanoperedens sp.]|nr:nucleoside deaminase [Candidatus Methanoperedens sp.]